MPLQIVLLPPLISFPNGFTSLQKEVRRMQSRGWFDIFMEPRRVSTNPVAGDRPRMQTYRANG
eukprot:2014859-Pleurochrysis_carterae.AAC.1